MSRASIYGAFSKVEEQADGSLYVEGIASTESRDSQGEVILASAMRKALPDYLRFPALREMHKSLAAGRTLHAEVDDAGVTRIAAKVVDPVAISKVKERVYNGFSIGGAVKSRDLTDPTIIDGLDLTEISLVDRPANPDAVLELVKLDGEPMPEQSKAEESKPTETTPPLVVEAQDSTAGSITPPAAVEPAVAAEPEAPAVKVSAEALAALHKFAGAEAFDAKVALEALIQIQSLLSWEQGESHAEAPEQVADLQAACERIKAFIASEIKEPDPAAEPAAEVVEAAAQTTDLAKRATDAEQAASAAGEALAKVLGERDDLQKRFDAQAAELAELRVQAATKGVLRVVGKADDTGAAPAEPEPDDVASLIRKAHRTPITLNKF